MKNFHRLPTSIGLALLCLALAGCQTHKRTTHLSNGYEETFYRGRAKFNSDDPAPTRTAFQYKSPDEKLTLIWPSLYGVGEVIHDDVAIFVGDKTFADGDTPSTHPRLFAVKAPELPLDITSEVLSRWAKSTHRALKGATQRFNIVTPEATDDGVVLHLEFLTQDYLMEDKDWPDKADVQLTWDQVTEIMQAVKVKGTLQKDIGWHTPYIGENF